MKPILLLLAAGLFSHVLTPTAARAADDLGLFTDHGDIGIPSTLGPGSTTYDPAKKTFTITGGGLNVWANVDALHFVWKKVSAEEGANIALSASVEFSPAEAASDPHRKAVVMFRQSLDPASPYADACIHGNGMAAIQWRDTKGDVTYETQAQANAPKRLRLEKRGNYLSMSFGTSDTDLKPAGGACKVEFTGDFYVGIGVCPHNAARLEKATFADVALAPLAPIVGTRTQMVSTLETIQVSSKDRRTVTVITQPQLRRAEAPNWSADNMLYFNNGGKLLKIKADLPAATPPTTTPAAPETIDLGILTNINNDHAISPDGKWMAVSDQSQGNRQSSVWTVPIGGATAATPPKRLTELTPSYFHGWSPDGKLLAFCGQRNNVFSIYTIAAEGGAETRLTQNTAGKDDGPEYSPDGKFIYFNSDRTGSMQIFRMKADGSGQEQLTKDDNNNWFPHISPNGQQMVFIAYEKGVTDHPENKDVQLKIMNLSTGAITTLAKLFGGQGTMNVPSWSPNSQYIAFMSYQIIPQ